jgi:hypothetical protein
MLILRHVMLYSQSTTATHADKKLFVTLSFRRLLANGRQAVVLTLVFRPEVVGVATATTVGELLAFLRQRIVEPAVDASLTLTHSLGQQAHLCTQTHTHA